MTAPTAASSGRATARPPVPNRCRHQPGAGRRIISDLTAVGNQLFFEAYDGVHGVELWKTDGTTTGTVMVKDINPGAAGSNPAYDATLINLNGRPALHGQRRHAREDSGGATAPRRHRHGQRHQPRRCRIIVGILLLLVRHRGRPAVLRGRRWHARPRTLGERRHDRRNGLWRTSIPESATPSPLPDRSSRA